MNINIYKSPKGAYIMKVTQIPAGFLLESTESGHSCRIPGFLLDSTGIPAGINGGVKSSETTARTIPMNMNVGSPPHLDPLSLASAIRTSTEYECGPRPTPSKPVPPFLFAPSCIMYCNYYYYSPCTLLKCLFHVV